MLFSLSGRLSRTAFLFVLIVTGLLTLTTVYALKALASSVPAASVLLLPTLYLAMAWIGIALAVRRLHDRDKSAGWLLPFILLPFLLGQIANRIATDLSGWQIAAIPMAIGASLALWGFVEMAFFPGTRGDNRFGPAPGSGPRVTDGLD